MVVLYFPPSDSPHHVGSKKAPYEDLSKDLLYFETLGHVMLVGDYNGWTANMQARVFDSLDFNKLHPLDLEELGLARITHDKHEINTFGQALLALAGAHRLVIFNGLP